MSDLIFTSDIYGVVGFIPYPVDDGASEVLEFNTDILPSYTNKAEERNQMRAIPRQSFQYSYKATLANMQEIYNAIWKNIRGKWLVPLWFEAQKFNAIVDQTSIAVDTLLHDLRANTHALIFKSICQWQVVTISEITDTSVTCDALTFNGYAFIIPFRVGFFSAQSNMAPSGYKNSFKANFYVDDVLAGLTDSATQYAGLDLYTTPYLMDGNTGSTQIIFSEDQVEFLTGNIDHSTTWANAQYSKQYLFQDQGVQAYRDFKNYFYRRAGKFRPFYSPTFESNLQSRHAGIVGTTFKFKDEGYTDNLFALRKKLGFQLTDGSWLIRNVSSTTHLGDNVDQLELDSALTVNANKIARVSFVSQNRLDTDRIEIALMQNANFRATANVMELTP